MLLLSIFVFLPPSGVSLLQSDEECAQIDIVTLDNRAIQRVIRDVENDDLLLSLKVASEEVKEIVFSNMSQRMVETFKEEMEIMGPVRLRDVEEAQSRIVGVVRKLEEAGEIVIARGGGDDIIV